MKEKTVPEKQEVQVPETREESRTLTPPVDIFEVADGLAVVVDLPGVEKGDVDVRVEDNTLTIAGKAKAPIPGDLLYREYELASYFRQFQLNEEVDQEKIRAEVRSGVLTVQLPKSEKATPKTVKVNVAS
jgi:HSP20 family protein